VLQLKHVPEPQETRMHYGHDSSLLLLQGERGACCSLSTCLSHSKHACTRDMIAASSSSKENVERVAA